MGALCRHLTADPRAQRRPPPPKASEGPGDGLRTAFCPVKPLTGSIRVMSHTHRLISPGYKKLRFPSELGARAHSCLPPAPGSLLGRG